MRACSKRVADSERMRNRNLCSQQEVTEKKVGQESEKDSRVREGKRAEQSRASGSAPRLDLVLCSPVSTHHHAAPPPETQRERGAPAPGKKKKKLETRFIGTSFRPRAAGPHVRIRAHLVTMTRRPSRLFRPPVPLSL